MFRIDTTGTIWINKGDTAKTQFFINTGTPLYPSLYTFERKILIESSPNINDHITLNKEVWSEKVLDYGEYIFIWTYIQELDIYVWMLDDEEVLLKDYGITLDIKSSDIQENSTIVISYYSLDNNSEIYFYIWQPLQQYGQVPVLHKIIKPYSNEIKVERDGKDFYTEKRNCVNEEGNINLYLNPQDTANIPEGEYRYQIIAKLYINNSYITNTICNKTPFIIIDDDYSDRKWS